MSVERTSSDAGNTGKLFGTALVLLLLLLLLLLFLYLLATSSGDHLLGSTLGNTAGRAAGRPCGGPAPSAGSTAAANAQSVCIQTASVHRHDRAIAPEECRYESGIAGWSTAGTDGDVETAPGNSLGQGS